MSKYLDNTGLTTFVGLVKTGIAAKQDTLTSGTNIKTINNTSLLGSGNISISGGDPVALTNAEIDSMWDANNNYLKLSGTSFSAGNTGTVTEVGSGYYYDQANSNPPVVYDANGNVVGSLRYGTSGMNAYSISLSDYAGGPYITLNDVSNPTTYTVNGGGGSL